MNHPDIDKRFRKFLADQEGAIEQLREFVGGEVGPRLDGSVQSLELLDAFVESLRRDSNWARSPLFEGFAGDPLSWLTVRLAYYFGEILVRRFGSEWQLSRDRAPNVPVILVGELELSPLEVASSYLAGQVHGGLLGLLVDLEARLAVRN